MTLRRFTVFTLVGAALLHVVLYTGAITLPRAVEWLLLVLVICYTALLCKLTAQTEPTARLKSWEAILRTYAFLHLLALGAVTMALEGYGDTSILGISLWALRHRLGTQVLLTLLAAECLSIIGRSGTSRMARE